MGDNNPNAGPINRRSSISQAAMTDLFQRAGSVSGASPFAQQPIPTGAKPADAQRRRLSLGRASTTGTSPTNTNFSMRRGSTSTNSDSIDENAIEDDDYPGGAKATPSTPFARRMSFGASSAMRNYRPSGSPNGNEPSSPPSYTFGRSNSTHKPASLSAALAGRRPSVVMPGSSLTQASTHQSPRTPSDNILSRTDQQGYNWSEQLRTRAESSVTGARPSFSQLSATRASPHDRAKSVSDMPQPPAQAPVPMQKPERAKPDAFQERILKGDFYMD